MNFKRQLQSFLQTVPDDFGPSDLARMLEQAACTARQQNQAAYEGWADGRAGLEPPFAI